MTLRSSLTAILLSTLVILAGTSLALQRVFVSNFAHTLGINSLDAMLLVSKSVDEQIQRIENLSSSVMTDPEVQQDLTAIRVNPSSYSIASLSANISDRLLTFAFTERSIENITIVDNNGDLFSAGSNTFTFGPREIQEAQGIAVAAGGGNDWYFPGNSSGEIVSVREVRRIAALDFSKLGTVIIRVNIRRLIIDTLDLLQRADASLVIMRNANVLFAQNPELGRPVSVATLGRPAEYDLVHEGPKTYFGTSMRSSRLGWTFVVLTPYQRLQSAFRPLADVGLVALCLCFGVTILFGSRLIRSVTHPLERLAGAMKQIESEELRSATPVLGQGLHLREIEQLYEEFAFMISRIDSLVNERQRGQILLKESQLQALQAQINPHFLYNTLESINSLAKVARHAQIAKMVRSLGNLLRSSLSDPTVVESLGTELNLLEDYLQIQRVRFGPRLRVDTAVSPELCDYAVPKLVLQPIVENSIKYGLEAKSGECHVRVCATRSDGGALELIVSDNGTGMGSAAIEGALIGTAKRGQAGIGLKNIDDRIKLIFGSEFGIMIHPEKTLGTTVVLRLPAILLETFLLRKTTNGAQRNL